MSELQPGANLPELGRLLRQSGLRAPMVAAALGVKSAVHAAARRETLALDWSALARTKAGALIALFVGQRRLGEGALRAVLGDEIASLTNAGLLAFADGSFQSRCALLPVGEALICSAWKALPDDSSFHLSGVLPYAPCDWLDVGTGSAFAPLVCAGRSVHACDVDTESIELAGIGLGLNDRASEIELSRGDLFESAPERPFRLVTFNAPIEGAAQLLPRFWTEVRRHLDVGGVAVTHSLAGYGPPVDAGGLLVSACYTPETASPGFALSAWYPDKPAGHLKRFVTLSSRQPHARPDWISPEDIG